MNKTLSIELIRQIFNCTNKGEIFYSDLCGKSAGKRADKQYCGIYSKVKIFGDFEYAHRIIFAWKNGFFPEIVDHIDGNTKNNSFDNLREVNASQSAWNTKNIRKNSTTKCKGVHFEKYTNKYRAEIVVNSKKISLGRFITLDEAIRARKSAEEKYFGEYARHI